MKRPLICGILATAIILIVWNDAVARSYRGTAVKWTKGGRVYNNQNFDVDVLWRATLLSDELKEAQANEWRKKLNTEPNFPTYEGIRFFVNLYTLQDLKGFSMNPDSVWRIVLVGANGDEVSPINIEPVRLTPTEKHFYPFITRWSKLYYVDFPNIDLGDHPKLVLRSILADSTVRW